MNISNVKALQKSIPNVREGREAIACGRFSGESQEQGTSEKRQAKSFTSIVSEYKLIPSTTHKIFDKAKSAYHAKHLGSAAELGKFLRQLEQTPSALKDANGNMPVLCYEAVDRISRLHPMEANDLISGLVKVGIAIVFYESDMWVDIHTISKVWDKLQSQIESAHQYSERLARRMRDARQDIRENGKVTIKGNKRLRKTVPNWVTLDSEGKYTLDNDNARIVRSACLLAIQGLGMTQIKRQLGITGKQFGGLADTFHQTSLVGQLVYVVRHGTKDEDREVKAVKDNAYPALLTWEEYHQLQASIAKRRKAQGRRNCEVVRSLFTGLTFNSEGQALNVYLVKDYATKTYTKATLKTGNTGRQLNYLPLERAMLDMLQHFTPTAFAPKLDDEQQSKLSTIRNKLAEAKVKIVSAKEIFEAAPSKAVAESMRNLEIGIAALEREEATMLETLACKSQEARVNEAKSLIAQLATLTGQELFVARSALKTLIASLVERIEIDVHSSTTFTAEVVWTSEGRTNIKHDGLMVDGEAIPANVVISVVD